ncbi:MAG TPA: histidine triad nucleotide-binding protein [Polyangia bacterium]|nr:histidine triad nucleotide-binding protein [Polyangia bacterium]
MSDCLFCKIADGTIKTELLAQDDRAVAFRDIRPLAPTHLLVVPRKHIASLNELTEADEALVGHLHVMARQLAAAAGLADGYRTVINTGAHAGQTVFHIHLHVVGGRPLVWEF